MLPNAKLRKKIISEDGEIIGYSSEWYPLKLILNSNARRESVGIAEGLNSGKFTAVFTTRTTLLDNNASKIEVDDKIDILFNKQSRIVKYVEESPKQIGNHTKVYFVGVE